MNKNVKNLHPNINKITKSMYVNFLNNKAFEQNLKISHFQTNKSGL